ncbi:hypothetical protein U6G28_06430 [Actinomycetaceae bacterium MB13-C1-2]|nr:hypothetical protein U6G28_06430 [Actinomycetaceae bacterium MB13-C1-2]
MDQHARGCFVDVLSNGDKGDSRFFQREVDGHVVGSVACESVDLVDDAVVDLVSLDVFDHSHEFGAVSFASGFTGIDELINDDCIEFPSFPKVCFALSWDRKALFPTPAFRLFLGGDAEVGDG